MSLLLVHGRDPHESGALLDRRRALAGTTLQRDHEIVPPLLVVEDPDACVERRQIRRIAVDAPLPQRQRAIGIAERLGELRGLAEDLRARGIVRLEVRLPLEDCEPLLRAIGLRVERREPARDRELFVLGGAVHRGGFDEQLDRAVDVGHPLEPRACGLGEQLDLAGGFDVRRVACRGGDAIGVAIVMTTAVGELTQLLLGVDRLGREREQRRVVVHRGRWIVELGEARRWLLRRSSREPAGSIWMIFSRIRITSRGRDVASKCERSRSSAESRTPLLAFGASMIRSSSAQLSLSSSASTSSGLTAASALCGSWRFSSQHAEIRARAFSRSFFD